MTKILEQGYSYQHDMNPKEERAHLPVSKETVCALRGSKKKHMAIYSLNTKTCSRSGGASAGSRSDYINREKQYANDAQEVLEKQSGNMPEWAQENSKKYWEAADVYERANGRLFKQVMFALPNELKPEEQKELVKEFAEQITNTKDGKLPYSYAIHKGHDSNNPHCHMMISERVLDGHDRSRETWFKRASTKSPELGGSKKSEALKPKQWLLDTRELWSQQANLALEKAGQEARIDHRSLEAQGIDREPTKHRGVALNAMLKSGKLTQEEIEKPLEAEANKEKELSEALDLKALIAQGMSEARQGYADERNRQQEEKIAQQERLRAEQQRYNEERARERERQAQERKTQEALQERNKPKEKNRGMGFSR